MRLSLPTEGKFTGLAIELTHFGRVELTGVLAQNTETQLYYTDCPRVLVKMFDLSCGKPDEVSYGPYMSFGLELANFEDLQRIEELRAFVPGYHGAHIDYQQKHAYIAMEWLDGLNLRAWGEEAARTDYPGEWLDELRSAVYETLWIMCLFHRHGIILIDFKPENVIRLPDHSIKFVDLGACFMPRHHRQPHTFVYSATPDHAEVLIDACNLQTGIMPSEASDVFSAGVALFEMATGGSRLALESYTADEMLSTPETHLFRDSQIRDVWRAYPHLKDVLPLVHTQLKERRILFSEIWHLLKAYVARQVPGWEGLDHAQQDQILLATGTTFILEQLPPPLLWLAGPIAQATALRSVRVRTVPELMQLLANPIAAEVREDLAQHNGFLRSLEHLELSTGWLDQLNTWESRLNGGLGHWAVAAPAAWRHVPDSAPYTFLHATHQDDKGHRYYEVVDDLEADDLGGERLTFAHVANDHSAWLC